MNLATIIVLAIVLAIIALDIAYLIHLRRSGRGTCSCSSGQGTTGKGGTCSGCSGACGTCPFASRR